MANRECLGYNIAGFRWTRVEGHHQSESCNQEKRQPDHQGELYVVKKK